MATITATGASSIISPRYLNSGLYSISGKFNYRSSSGDVVQMIKVPPNFTPKEIFFQGSTNPLSAGGNSLIQFSIGDGNVPARYMSASASFTAYFRMGHGVLTDMFYEYSAADTIDVTINGITGTDSASQTTSLGLIVVGAVDD